MDSRIFHWHLFVGPTAHRLLLKNNQIILHRPVRSGDLISLSPDKMTGVIICDGVYWTQPALQIQEILFAIHSGAVVVGVSSYGALRYADITEEKGMLGYGEICKFYRHNRLCDDADVAVMHNNTYPYQAYTVPIINILFTLKSLSIDDDVSRQMVATLRKLPVAKRTWRNFEAILREDKHMYSLLRQVKSNYLDQKFCDLKNVLLNLQFLEKMEAKSVIGHKIKWKPTTWWERRLVTSRTYNNELKAIQAVSSSYTSSNLRLAQQIALNWWDTNSSNNDDWIQKFAHPATIPYVAQEAISMYAQNKTLRKKERKYQSRYIEELIKYIAGMIY